MTDKTDARTHAMRLLAMREHSRCELERKLQHQCTDATGLAQILDQLEQQGWLSDERFTGQYITMRVHKGFGPLKIRAELMQRGIDHALIDAGLDDHAVDWFACLQRVVQRKYVHTTKPDQREQARRARFLHSRGFPESLIKRHLWG